MAKFIIEVDEGCTLCEQCPFADSEICEGAFEVWVFLLKGIRPFPHQRRIVKKFVEYGRGYKQS